jgi:acetyl esterase
VPEPELRLDPDAAGFLEQLAWLDVPAGPRARYEFLCSHFGGERVELNEVCEIDAPVRGRLYFQGAGPLLVWFHGGRFISGSLETHDAVCRRLARALDGRVLAVDYRLAPEHPFPAAFEDARAAADYALSLDAAAAAGGDSAGAALALACGLDTAALVYPMLDPACGAGSHARFAGGPGPSSEDMRAGWAQFLPAGARFSIETAHVRRALLFTAECDPLLDEGLSLLQRLSSIEHCHFKGQIHGFLTYPARFSAAQTVVDRIALFLRSGS